MEVCVGAILTQNTSWQNVERAIANLKRAKVLSLPRLHTLSERQLAELIRPAGYFNVKARRLRAFVDEVTGQFAGRLRTLFAGETSAVRARLLAIPGIGPETADSMLLYAGGHRSFVVDAYTRRIFARHGWCAPEADYDTLQRLCTNAFRGGPAERELDLFQDCHAQLVMVGKEFCRPRDPRCPSCPLAGFLPAGAVVNNKD